jgi:nucleotide-binding universal stress UspA family protein
MSLPRNILVPTDFSRHAERALDYAVELAAKLDARVHLLNVVGLPIMGPELGFAVTASMIDAILDDNQKALDKLVAARTGKAAFGPTLLRTGDARTVIDTVAEELKADLVIMGTHGRRGVSRMLLGSVAESIVRTAPCPVLLVRSEAS